MEKKLVLVLYLYEYYQILKSKETFEDTEENLSVCVKKQAMWDMMHPENTSILKRETCENS